MMVRKKLALVVAALGALQTDVASALGLGELTLNSALNQPLEAEIKLLDTGDLDASQVLIELGSKEDFDRAGVSRDFFLSNMRFNVEIDENGQGVIRVNTKENVIEPYLDFIIEARWPNGRILREYTVLLDLPTYSAAPAPAITSSPVARSIEQQTETVTLQPAPQPKATIAGPSARESLRQGNLEPGDTYRVQRDETLWEIAAKSKPQGTSVQQTMLGIQRLNPNAFIKGNINRLKAGYVLRLPTDSDIADITEPVAKKEVANQNKAWRTGEPTTSLLSEAPLDASVVSSSEDEVVNDEARLSIAGSGTSSAADSDGVGTADAGSAGLDDELNAAEESLDQAKRHNEELAGRLSDMEAKMATLQRLLELKEDQLAALQASKGEPAVEAAPAPQPKESPAPAPAPKPVAPVAEPSFVDQLLGNPVYLGAAGGVIALAVIAAMIRRRKQVEEEQLVASEFAEESDADELADVSLGDEADFNEVATEVEAEVEQEEPSVGDFANEEVVDEVVEESAPVQSETGDAIAEADIYIAYGRFQQAMDLLKSAHAQEPQRSDVLVKLLEVCLEARDKPSFQEYYVGLQGLGDEGAIIQVKEMLSTVDGVADWLDDLPGSAPAMSDADMDAELIEGEDEVSLESDESLEPADQTLELDAVDIGLDDEDMDLDLDLDLEGDELSDLAESQTMQFDTSALDEHIEGTAGSVEEGSLDLGELDDLELDDAELSPELDALDSDDGELDLADLEAELSADAEGSSELALDVELDSEGGDLGDLALEDELDLGADLELAVDLEGESEPESLDLEADIEEELSIDTDLSASLGDMELSPELDALEAELDDAESLDAPVQVEAEVELQADDALELELEGSEESLQDLDDGQDLQLDDSELDIDLEDAGELDLSDLEGELDAGAEPEADLGDVDAMDLGELEAELDADLSDSGLALDESEEAADSFDEPVAEDDESDDEFDFLADTDEVATKLDLARAYIDMGDTDGAKDILDEVLQEGNDEQKQEANSLLERV